MKRKLKRVLLIDDSESDNFFHSRIIRKAGITDEIKVVYSGEEALEYLVTEMVQGGFPSPTLIFLDINMPGMNGWEFLDEYDKLAVMHKGEIILTMLSNSIDSPDLEQAKVRGNVAGYYSKPLEEEYLLEILQRHFPDYLEDSSLPASEEE
ncbi:response regulator [Neolewinella lacunae]|uniref:Response regulator n=1 Tax=Neolewinella lacunae TaxID=1517758 RepID=A0A923PL60_9BACT|nr:response regulator [Neolewinella lacunae]MBC6993304.1 response regulator [Neolewinella lacunae]MDN3636855.1 response regulator [Neolewinella lacunae]